MDIAELEKYYGNPYHGAYYEIKRTLVKHGFYWIQGSTYMTNADKSAQPLQCRQHPESHRLVPQVRARYSRLPSGGMVRLYRICQK